MLRFDLAKGDDALVQKLDAPVDGIVTDGTIRASMKEFSIPGLLAVRVRAII